MPLWYLSNLYNSLQGTINLFKKIVNIFSNSNNIVIKNNII